MLMLMLMLVPGDYYYYYYYYLGFRFAVIFFVVFPALGLFLRRKWRLSVARTEEINRLIVLAAEEAARAELEATASSVSSSSIGYSYGYGSPAVAPIRYVDAVDVAPGQRVCAVCFVPTPNRCARCKSVHYCSGKCQIVHWRQGHKDECHPLPASSGINDEASDSVGLATKQTYSHDCIGHIENDGLPYDEQGDSAPKEAGFFNPAYSPSHVSVKDGNASVYIHVEKAGSTSELNDSLESPDVRASFPGRGICIDDSFSDDDSLHDVTSDSCDSSSAFDNLETSSSERPLERIKPLQEETHFRVESDGSVYGPGGLKHEVQGGGFSGLRVSDKNSVEPPISSSGFWDGTLDTTKTRKYVPYNSSKPKFVVSESVDPSDCKSTQQFLSNLSGTPSSDTNSQISHAPDDSYAGSSRAVKLDVQSTLPAKESADVPVPQRSTSLSSKRPDSRVKVVTSNGYQMKSEESNSKNNGIAYQNSGRANNLERKNKDALQSLASKKDGISSKHPNGPSSSAINGQLPVRSLKPADIAAMHPQLARSAPSASVGLLKVADKFRAPRSLKLGDGGGKNSEAVFPYELFVQLYHWNKVELRPCGLINCGNSCYANSVLQCLAFTPPLTAYLLQGLHSKSCVRKDWCFTCEFERLIMRAKKGYPLSPIGILSQIQKIGSRLTNGREEDAHEFLRYAIETMQSICLREAGVKASNSLEEETTLMGLTFGGYLRSKIKCAKCHGKSEKQDRIMDLTVEIEGDIETLEDALRQFTGTESLDGENKYHCGRCKSYEKAKKKLSISEAPNVLTIALKRFQSGKFGKLNKPIRFPEILNLAPYMRGGSDKSPIYRLYGVVVHLDIMNASFSGHYVSYVRNAQNKWYKIDDSTVKPVELERVLSKGAYMLFYSRCSPRAPKSIRSSIISRDLPSKMRYPEVDPSPGNRGRSTSRHRDVSGCPNDFANHGYVHQDETRLRPVPNIFDFDSSSDNSSIFSQSDEVSTSTDGTRESISADDISEYIFGHNAFFRHSSDSDTSSSSSSSSSSPQYMKHSPLSNSDRNTSGLSEQSVLLGDHSKTRHEAGAAEESGSVGGVTFLHSNSREQVRNPVNSSRREADAVRLGRANPLDNGKSGVHQRRSTRNRSD